MELRGGKKKTLKPVNNPPEKAAKRRKTQPKAPSAPVPPGTTGEGDAAEMREEVRTTAETIAEKEGEAQSAEKEAETEVQSTDEEAGEEDSEEEVEEAEAEAEATEKEEESAGEDDSDDEVTESNEREDEGEEMEEERDFDSHADGRNSASIKVLYYREAWAEKEAMKPAMYFPPEEYSKNIKVSIRCHILEVLETFNDLDLSESERVWFEEHVQFRHIMHMPKSNHMVQPMWMLLVRTAEIERKKEAWFVVNGIPIRYRLREHAMISGLDCRNYPLGWEGKGSSSFKKKYFPDKKKKDKKKLKKNKILREDVRERLKKMRPDDTGDRLKMAVLYFLSSIVYCPTKAGPAGKPVLDIFVRYVADLDLCKTFPWGRFSFDMMLESIHSTMSHFSGEVSGDWTIPGFCLPLGLLAMEAIPELGRSFREPVAAPHDDCPRMCKGKWVKCELRGWPLETVYEKLGKTKDIESVLIASDEENEFMDSIMETEDDVDEHDPVVESWDERIFNGFTVEFEDMMEEDAKWREKKEERTATVGRTRKSSLAELTVAMHSLIDQMGILNEKVDKFAKNFEDRVKALEEYVKYRKGKVYMRRES